MPWMPRGTLLVDRRRSGHAEGDDDRATVLLNHVHRATAKSLKPGTVREMTVKDSPKPEQLSSSRAPTRHVKTREHRVDDADP